MRHIIVFNNISADGYFASTRGALDWVVSDDEVGKAGMERSSGVDTVLFGRRTYDMFAAFWPHALDDSPTAPDPHVPRRRSATLRAMAEFLNDTPKLVFSRTLTAPAWRNTRVLPALEPRELDAMKRGPGKDLLIFGSGSIVAQLTEHGLIDEYQLVVSPVLLGGGASWLTGVTGPRALELVEAKPFASGVVLLRYTRKG